MPNTPNRADFILKIISFLFLLAFLSLFFYRPLEMEDVWWHLATGRFIWEHKMIPNVDVFSFSQTQAPWIIHHWLGSLITYWIYLFGDLQGLQIFRALLFIIIFGIFYLRARKHLPFLMLLFLIFITALSLDGRVLLRPFLFNLIFIQLYLMILFDFIKRESKAVYCIPFLTMIWFNLHLGALVHGSIILGIFLLYTIVDYVQTKTNPGKIKTLSIVIIAHFLATIVNPYGIEGALFPFERFLQVFFAHADLYKDIGESKSPIYLLNMQGIPVIIIFIFGLWALTRKQPRTFLYTLLFFISFFLFLYNQRGILLFIWASLYIFVEVMAEREGRLRNITNGLNRIIMSIFVLILTASIIHILNKNVIINGRVSHVYESNIAPGNPQEALDFLNAHNISGQVFTSMNYGGYVLWNNYPAIKPFIDGRQVNEALYTDFLHVFTDPNRYWPLVGETHKFNIVLFDVSLRTNYTFAAHLLQNPKWQLVFVKGANMVFVRRNAFDLPREINTFEDDLKNEKILTTDAPSLSKQNPLKEFLFPPAEYVDTIEEGGILYLSGLKEAGLNRTSKAYQETRHPKARLLLSLMLKEYFE